MTTYGATHCVQSTIENCFSASGEACIWYYDGARAYYQIADYTGDDSWKTCAEYVLNEYTPRVQSGNCTTPPRRMYLDGVARHWQETSSAADKTLSQTCRANNGAIVWTGGAGDFDYPREYSMALRACLAAEFVKQPNTDNPFDAACANRDAIKDILVDYLKVWTASSPPYTGSASASPCTFASGCHPPYVKPFFIGLVHEALIEYDYWLPNAAVRTAVLENLQWLYATSGLWREDLDSFDYSEGADDDGSALDADLSDLNMLIAPGYAWGWRQNGSATFLEVGDKLFNEGAATAYLGGGKQFTQNYRSSFDFVHWRLGGALYP